MDYSITNVKELADCDVLLSRAAKEKADLDFKKLSDERLTARYAATSAEIEAELQGVLAEIAATETIIAMLPEGNSKEEAINKKTRLEYKKFLLETRKENNGAVALLEKEMDLFLVLQQISEVERFISVLQDRKAVLLAQA